MDIKQNIADAIAKILEKDPLEIAQMLENPPDDNMGDLAFPTFTLAKQLRKAPPAIAADILAQLPQLEGVTEVKPAGAYLNFYFDRKLFAAGLLGGADFSDWGREDIGHGRNVCIDYSSINIAKPFHIGHLSSTAIGGSLARIYRFLGYTPIGINHLGDWGTQFGKLIYAYKAWGDDAEIERDSVSAMLKLYVKFHEEAENDPSLNDEGRAWFRKIEEGDVEAHRIFSWFSKLSLAEAEKVYALLGIKFDYYTGESFYNDKMQPVIDELRDKGLLEEDKGAYIVRLDEYGLPPAVVLKTDGATLYITRDLAAADYRKGEFDFAKSLYVVAYQQTLHFKQLFATLKKMGRGYADDLQHIAFGMVSLEDATLSTRKGNVVLLQDVLESAVEKTLATINEKNPELENKEEIAKQVGVGAIIYSTLSAGRIKDISFSFDRVLNFDGETGPYVQYTHARAGSVLRNWQSCGETPDYSALASDDAFAVLKQLANFPDAVRSACEKNEPSMITRSITLLSQLFNRFYFEQRIIDQDKQKTAARCELTRAVRDVIKTGLYLLGISAPERM